MHVVMADDEDKRWGPMAVFAVSNGRHALSRGVPRFTQHFK